MISNTVYEKRMMTFRFVYYFSINNKYQVFVEIKGIIKNEFFCSKSCVLIPKRLIIQIIIVFISNEPDPFIQRFKRKGNCLEEYKRSKATNSCNGPTKTRFSEDLCKEHGLSPRCNKCHFSWVAYQQEEKKRPTHLRRVYLFVAKSC